MPLRWVVDIAALGGPRRARSALWIGPGRPVIRWLAWVEECRVLLSVGLYCRFRYPADGWDGVPLGGVKFFLASPGCPRCFLGFWSKVWCGRLVDLNSTNRGLLRGADCFFALLKAGLKV